MLESVEDALCSFLRSAVPDAAAVALGPLRVGGEDGADRSGQARLPDAHPIEAPAEASNGVLVVVTLYAVEEDMSGRTQGTHSIRAADGRTTARRAFPRRYVLHFGVSAVGSSVREEHKVLSRLAALLSEHDAIPRAYANADLISAGDLTVRFAMPMRPSDVDHGYDSSTYRELAQNHGLVLRVAVVAPMAAPIGGDLAPAPDSLRLGVGRGGLGTLKNANGAPPGLAKRVQEQ
ncbi:MAG: DUF4255 domain-containing protein [Actinomycetota bacterium]|nr:DUF4255 domain-containing protein [Actinomycetota bacterium]